MGGCEDMQWGKESFNPSGAEWPGSCEAPIMGAGNWTLVLYESSIKSLLVSCSSSLKWNILEHEKLVSEKDDFSHS